MERHRDRRGPGQKEPLRTVPFLRGETGWLVLLFSTAGRLEKWARRWYRGLGGARRGSQTAVIMGQEDSQRRDGRLQSERQRTPAQCSQEPGTKLRQPPLSR